MRNSFYVPAARSEACRYARNRSKSASACIDTSTQSTHSCANICTLQIGSAQRIRQKEINKNTENPQSEVGTTSKKHEEYHTPAGLCASHLWPADGNDGCAEG